MEEKAATLLYLIINVIVFGDMSESLSGVPHRGEKYTQSMKDNCNGMWYNRYLTPGPV